MLLLFVIQISIAVGFMNLLPIPVLDGGHLALYLVEAVMGALRSLGIHKVALVVFSKNEEGNAFWERTGFATRDDLIYRNKAITEMIRMDT